MESTTPTPRRSRKIRLTSWTLLFFSKTEHKNPGTRLDIMRKLDDFLSHKEIPSIDISGKCILTGIPASLKNAGIASGHSSSYIKTIRRAKHNERGKTEAKLLCITDSQGTMFFISLNEYSNGMKMLLIDIHNKHKLSEEKEYYLDKRYRDSVYL